MRYLQIKYFFDFYIALAFLPIVFLPLLFIALFVLLIDRVNPIYFGERVGQNGTLFTIFKIRTLKQSPDLNQSFTTGYRDPRLTLTGGFLRKTKIDEIPQLLNILKGEMSFVGPRPEIKHYVDMYSDETMKCLLARPGLTDLSSIYYFDLQKCLRDGNPELLYVEHVFPHKNRLRVEYAQRVSFALDFRILCLTLLRLIHF